ncbi:MAG: PAS domain S-box protein [Firmicutes bacterium HGW-Firmicutes-7]|nr:MAG: PAS domain S-box protein [Firmicutes bacterium HGW-Firmicutes-7]
MSELINNREYRQQQLKKLITQLHEGKSVSEVKGAFEELIQGVSPTEISEMEQALINEGMPVEEIQRLCDVHAEVFKGSIEEIHRTKRPEDVPGHPVNTFYIENRELENLMHDKLQINLEEFSKNDSQDNVFKLIEDLNLLWDIHKHYLRKENLLFPYMEKYGITAPPKVMWGVDDEIRGEIKEIKTFLYKYEGNKEQVTQKVKEVIKRINDMIFKEENILFPMVVDTLSEDEWKTIEEDSDEFGYCLTHPITKWKPITSDVVQEEEIRSTKASDTGHIKFATGILTTEEISAMLNTLPLDVTFVDKDGLVKFFSSGKERIFPRTKSIIGREVSNCHPPASVHIVEKIVEDLKTGAKDHEDFWIKMGDKFVYIRYFAVRNEEGEFLGTLEVTQNINPIQALEGEKRLMSE